MNYWCLANNCVLNASYLGAFGVVYLIFIQFLLLNCFGSRGSVDQTQGSTTEPILSDT
jgi:hypothetical protein